MTAAPGIINEWKELFASQKYSSWLAGFHSSGPRRGPLHVPRRISNRRLTLCAGCKGLYIVYDVDGEMKTIHPCGLDSSTGEMWPIE